MQLTAVPFASRSTNFSGVPKKFSPGAGFCLCWYCNNYRSQIRGQPALCSVRARHKQTIGDPFAEGGRFSRCFPAVCSFINAVRSCSCDGQKMQILLCSFCSGKRKSRQTRLSGHVSEAVFGLPVHIRQTAFGRIKKG